MNDRHNLVAYLATIGAIVLLALAAAAVCLFAKVDSEVNLARIIGGLAFISAAIAGLTGIAGTFKASGARASAVADETLQTAVEKIPPVTGAAA